MIDHASDILVVLEVVGGRDEILAKSMKKSASVPVQQQDIFRAGSHHKD